MIAKFWNDLSVSKKLYTVVGVMAILIATELFTLLFAMDVMSAVRSFVGGEGLWSKAQKNAIYDLDQYVDLVDPGYWDKFQRELEIPRGDHEARIELEKGGQDYAAVAAGFVKGGNHPDDIKGMVMLIRRFYFISYIDRAIQAWRQADVMIDRIEKVAANVHAIIPERKLTDAERNGAHAEIERLNSEVTKVENEFSSALGEGSRWLEKVLMYLLILAVLTVESTGLFLTITFSRTLSRSLHEMMANAIEVGRGNFQSRLKVRSRDELGQLAGAINKMSEDLESSIGARRQAETASQIKSMFLANMSHEIRTPLGVMLGLAEILKEKGLSRDDQIRYIETIERTGKNLTRIINDILDLSKVEAGHLVIERTQFSLADFIRELSLMLSVEAAREENRLIFSPVGPMPETLVTDRVRLRQILVNLVNNALKFTSNGVVTVNYRMDKSALVFDVSDTGQGISESNRTRLFQPFSRGETQVEKSGEGTGLGLVLSQRLARALGGDVVLLKTEIGKGSTFRAQIEFDKEASAARAERKPVAPLSDKNKLEGRQILVVEDSEDNRLLINLFLSRMKANVQFAANGREGIQRATEKNYDAVLMDMQMPVMDGYKATRTLREQGLKCPIIALTAHAMKEDRERCLNAGCTDYLTKPIDSNILYNTLVKYIIS